MNVAKALRQRLSLAVPLGNPIREGWDRLSKMPGGRRAFSRLVGTAAPYTGTIDAQIESLEKGYARVVLNDRRKVRNHLDCVYAIALANLGELCGNVGVAYSLPDDARFIVAGLSMDYLAKARGRITAECRCPVPETSERQEYEVVVTMMNESGEMVCTCTMRTLVGPKKSA